MVYSYSLTIIITASSTQWLTINPKLSTSTQRHGAHATQLVLTTVVLDDLNR